MRHLLSLPRLASRAFSTTARQLKNKVPEKQKVFLEDNGLPVHIKGGTSDVLLYRLNHDHHSCRNWPFLVLAAVCIYAQE